MHESVPLVSEGLRKILEDRRMKKYGRRERRGSKLGRRCREQEEAAAGRVTRQGTHDRYLTRGRWREGIDSAQSRGPIVSLPVRMASTGHFGWQMSSPNRQSRDPRSLPGHLICGLCGSLVVKCHLPTLIRSRVLTGNGTRNGPDDSDGSKGRIQGVGSSSWDLALVSTCEDSDRGKTTASERIVIAREWGLRGK